MKVYIVQQSYPALDLTDDDLTVYGYDVAEIVGVYRNHGYALRRAADFQEEADRMEKELGCDPLEYTVAEWEVNEGGE